jgi:hypothetical protein
MTDFIAESLAATFNVSSVVAALEGSGGRGLSKGKGGGGILDRSADFFAFGGRAVSFAVGIDG